MNNRISLYQRVYNEVQKTLKNNENVLAAFVFGSIVSGDLWEKSDIDYFIVLKEYKEGIHNIYSDAQGPRVHFKTMDKREFLTNKELDLKGGFLHRLFSASKLVFCKDDEILKKFNEGRYYDDLSRQKWTLSYLGKLLKKIDATDKSLYNGHITAAFFSSMESMHFYAMVSLNSQGYMISRDNINIACNLNRDYERAFGILAGDGDLEEKVIKTQKFLKESIDKIIRDETNIIFNYLKDQNNPMSSNEIRNHQHFRSYGIEMEAILSLLHEKKLLKKDFREVRTNDGMLIMENVYMI